MSEDALRTRSLSEAQARERVYFLQAESGGPVKIGRANNVERRVSDIQRLSPVTLKVLAVTEGGAPLETELHQKFANDRRHGEWFEPSKALMDLVSRYASSADANDGDNRVVQHNMRIPQSSRDLLHEICRRLRHEQGFEAALRNFVSTDWKGKDLSELTKRINDIEQRLRGLEAK